MNSVLSCHNISKVFHDGNQAVQVLHNFSLNIPKGKSIALVGASGCGKSTLLHLLGGLDRPSSGSVFWGEQDIRQLNEAKKCRLRNHHLGFVYQFHHLLPEFTALENVTLPLLVGAKKISIKQAQKHAESLLNQVGLSPRLTHKPAQLSGGERQRVALARALVTKPQCILADEPTGNLDPKTADEVLHVLLEMQHSLNVSFLIATHSEHLASRLDEIVNIV